MDQTPPSWPLLETPKIGASETPYFDHFRAAQDEELFNLIEIKLPIDRSFYSSVNFSNHSFVLTFFNTSFNTIIYISEYSTEYLSD